MKILLTLSALALRGAVFGVCKAANIGEIDIDFGGAVDFLYQHFSNHGTRLPRALEHANDRAWRALEVALAGESLLSWLDRREDKQFREQIRDFLENTSVPSAPTQDPRFRKRCLEELRQARKQQLLIQSNPSSRELARHAGHFARYSDPQKLIQMDLVAITHIAHLVEQEGLRNLAEFLRLNPPGSPPLLAIAVRYFFRRAVENDEYLARGLMYDRLESLGQAQQRIEDHLERLSAAQAQAFQALHVVLTHHGQELDSALQLLSEIRENVLDIKEEQQRQGEQLQQLHRDVLQALEEHRLEKRELSPRDSLSVRTDAERVLVKQLVQRYRALSPEQQHQLPALLHALAKLEVVAGEYDSAQRNFQEVSALVGTDDQAQAEVFFNAYLTAIERQDWMLALLKLRAAVKLDPGRFAPFPFDKYEPKRILGAGGFGVVFLCQHQFMQMPVVVKALIREESQNIDQVFTEARLLQQLNDPTIVRVWDCGYADLASRARPFVVMEYFDGPTLQEYVRQNGLLPVEQLLPLARITAQALQAAHGKGVLHRDIKPANVLVRRQGDNWEVKLIDFGLAVQGAQTMRSTSRQRQTLSGNVGPRDLAGTLEYAAPEQIGRVEKVAVGTWSDVYGFGKTCCYALLGITQPSYHDWRKLGEGLANFLSACTAERAQERLVNFQMVLTQLDVLMRPQDDPLTVLPGTPLFEGPPEVIPLQASSPPKRSREPEILEVVPVQQPARPSSRKRVRLQPAPATPPPAPRPTPPPRIPSTPDGPAQVTRTHTTCTVLYNGHEIKCECSVWTNVARVVYDDQVMATGWPLLEGTYPFTTEEDGAPVQYEVVIRGPGISALAKPYFTVRRNGVVLFNDR